MRYERNRRANVARRAVVLVVLYAAVNWLEPGFLRAVPPDTPSEVIGRITDAARAHVKVTDWAPGTSFRNLARGYWCNLFVADVLREAGAATWPPIQERLGISPTRDPVAREWEDPSFAIRGWKVIYPGPTQTMTATQVLALRRSGDVVSGGGHVGIVNIVSSQSRVISASSMTGAVEHNNWSFGLPDQRSYTSADEYERDSLAAVKRFTVRRFVGVTP